MTRIWTRISKRMRISSSGADREQVGGSTGLLFLCRRYAAAWFPVAALVIYLAAYSMLAPVGSDPRQSMVIEIPRGASTADIAALLQREGLIRNAILFRVYAYLKGLDSRLQSGEYQFSPAMTVKEILSYLARGKVVEHSFTVPEGLTVEQVAALLESRGLGSRKRFLEVARSGDLRPEFVPRDVPLREPLEGYLFPETYLLTRGTGEEEIVRIMLDRFHTVFTPEFRRRARELGLSVHEVVTLASIIEKEAAVDRERPLISAVFHNRRRLGMRLDADPTVKYVMASPPQILSLKDLEVDSPYNTYKYAGLPPGPIANPGEAALRAALYPADVDYLFFVAKNDGTHVFSRTLREHLAAKQRYQK